MNMFERKIIFAIFAIFQTCSEWRCLGIKDAGGTHLLSFAFWKNLSKMGKFDLAITNTWAIRHNISSTVSYTVSYQDLEHTPVRGEVKVRKGQVFVWLAADATGVESRFAHGLPINITDVVVYRGHLKWITFCQNGR